jgi:hypothetical protein
MHQVQILSNSKNVYPFFLLLLLLFLLLPFLFYS